MEWQGRYTFHMGKEYTVDEIAAARSLTRNPAACRAIRVAADVSLNEMARSGVDCSPAALSRWERGLRRPGSAYAVAWARALRRLMQQGTA